jgi:hypothetical protein
MLPTSTAKVHDETRLARGSASPYADYYVPEMSGIETAQDRDEK